MKNWIQSPKTTLGALIILVSTGLFGFKIIDSTIFLSILGVAGAWIGMAAQDQSPKQ